MEYDEVDDFLEHFGVKGMRWGVNHAAKKDATEFARAKMYYGEGAGTRRKLIKARVESKSADPNYKQAFEKHLAGQNMAKRATEAKVQRKTTNVVKTTTKTGRGIINIVNGNPMAASAVAVAVVAGAKYAHDSGVDKVVANAGKTAYSKIKTEVRAMQIKQQFKNWMG